MEEHTIGATTEALHNLNEKNFGDLPEEILEYILSLVPPYRDLKSCKLVSKKWHNAVLHVVMRQKLALNRALKCNNLVWQSELFEKIPHRYSQAACYKDGIIYMFGGCSPGETAFNDLLALDLSTRTISRIPAKGTFPSPKASSTLCVFNNQLILFGGWTFPCKTSVHSPLLLYKELHVFDLETQTWSSRLANISTLPCGGHSATIHGSKMVLFGGVEMHNFNFDSNRSSCMYYLDLDTWNWSQPVFSNSIRPGTRFGHSQIYINEQHLLILGGRMGVRTDRTSHDDMWLFDLEASCWHPVTVSNPQWAPPYLRCHPVTRVDNLLVAFSRHASQDKAFESNRNPERSHAEEIKEENVNGKHGNFIRPSASSPGVSPGKRHPLDDLRFNKALRRQKQLETLAKYEKLYVKGMKRKDMKFVFDDRPRMNLYTADISDLLTSHKVVWQEPKDNPGSPTDRIFYSLIAANSELIVLGGLAGNGESCTDEAVVEEDAWMFGNAPFFMP